MATKKYRNKKLISSIYDIEPHYFAGLGDESQQLTIRPRGAQRDIYSWGTTTVGEGTPQVLGDPNNQLGRITMDPNQTNNSNLNIAGYNKLGRTTEGKEEPGYMDKYGLNWMSIGAGAANAGMQMYANLTEDDDLYDSGDPNAGGWKITSNLLGLGNSAYNLARPDASPEIQNQIKSNNAILDEAAKDMGQTIKINAMDDASNLDLFHSHVADDLDTDYDLSRNTGETIAGIGSSMLEGAKSGSIGGPWGALGGAVAGLGTGLIGAFNGTSQAKASERMRKIRTEQIARANEIDFRNRQTASKAITDFNINNYRIQSMTNPDIILQGANYAALGGPLFTNGGIFDNGINYVGAGGTHGQNKLGGVPMGIANDGQPNLVEEGEAIWHNGNDDYVFSNRIKIPKRLRTKYRFKDNVSTFADAVNYIQKASEERPNDPIEQRTIDNILKEFQTEQEIIRQRQAQREQEKMMRTYAQYPEMMQQMQMQQDPNAMQQMPPEMMMQQQMPQEVSSEGMPVMGAYGGPLFAGGGILIKPSKRGTFTAAATRHGMGVQEFANKVLANPEDYSPAMRKKANFARNASHWHGLGGHMFKLGGEETKKAIAKALGLQTKEDWENVLKWYDINENSINWDDWNSVRQNKALMQIIANDRPDLAYAIGRGYDFGDYTVSGVPTATIDSNQSGNWVTNSGVGWNKDSNDLAFKQAIEGLSEAQIKALTRQQLAERMRNTKAYQNTTQWLQNPDNALAYFTTLMNDNNTPPKAKDYAKKYIEQAADGSYKWKNGVTYDYDTMFKPVREDEYPGSYWYSVAEANRDRKENRYVINEDGSVTELWGEPEKGWEKSEFNWHDSTTDYFDTYYRKPKSTTTIDNTTSVTTDNNDGQVTPYNYKPDWMANLRYMPILGSGLNVLSDIAGWSNVPDYTYANALEQAARRRPMFIGYKPLGDYMTYNPNDRMFAASQIAQQQNSGRRALIDNANGDIGATQMGLLSNNFNTGITLGDLYDKERTTNTTNRKITHEFNRGTNQYNSTGYNHAQEFNANAYNNYLNTSYTGIKDATLLRQAEDARVDNALQANLTGLFDNMGELGREVYSRNMANANQALLFGVGNLGESFYKGLPQNMTDEQRRNLIAQLQSYEAGRAASGHSTANGGYITIKKGRKK